MAPTDHAAAPAADRALGGGDRRLALTLREIAWAIHRRAPERADVGPIPTTEVALLKQIVDAPGSTVGELARALGLQQSNTSAALRTLSARGLVARETSEADRRVVRVWITPEGLAEHEAIAEAWSADVVRAIALLPPDERAALEAAAPALARVHEQLRGA
jgi:DNA-binding MarR family transcriptional regulator